MIGMDDVIISVCKRVDDVVDVRNNVTVNDVVDVLSVNADN